MASLADLQRRIEIVRRKERKIILLTGVSKSVLTLIGMVLAYFLIDWVFDLPYFARLITVAGALGFVGYIVNKHLLRELKKIKDDDEIALRIESRNPDLRGRLISTLQLTRAEKTGAYVGSAELLQALETETVSMSEPLDFSRIINTQIMKKFGIAATIIVVIKIVLLIEFTDHFEALGGRLVHADARFPTKTRIKEIQVLDYVARGDDLSIKVLLDPSSKLPEEPGSCHFLGIGGGRVSIDLNRSDSDVFVGTLSKPVEDMEMVVKIGDAQSNPQKIRVLPRPEIQTDASSVQYKYPPYTQLPPPEPEKFGGLSILTGSKVDFTIKSTKALAAAKLVRSDGAGFELQKSGQDGTDWKLVDMPVEKSGSFHLVLIDTDKLQNSRPPVEYPIDARPDHPPVIKMASPSRDVTVIPTARANIVFNARDDFGIRVVWLVYRVQQGEGTGATPTAADMKRIELPNLPKTKDLLNARFSWDISTLGVKVGDQIIFWLETDDECTTNDTAPSRSRRPMDDPEAPKADEKVYSRTADLKLTVISREDKVLEWQAIAERIYQEIETAKDNAEEVKRLNLKLLDALDAIEKLKNSK
jgi:hypothetical protein